MSANWKQGTDDGCQTTSNWHPHYFGCYSNLVGQRNPKATGGGQTPARDELARKAAVLRGGGVKIGGDNEQGK